MLKFTDKARQRVLSFIEQESGEVALRVSVRSDSPLAPQYELALVDESDRQAADTVVDGGGFQVYVDESSAEKLEGASVDWIETMHGGGFQIENPNIKPVGTEAPSGELAQRIMLFMDAQINPAVASHGGKIKLVDVRDNVVYVELTGGCQGCGMATVTLKQGVERMIREAFPEIVDVIDVTDHTMGRNPYYQAS